MKKNKISKVYNSYAAFYDIIFNKVLDQGRKKAIGIMDFLDGEKILEIGIGTGLSLRHYPQNIPLSITGIDISEKMLAKAKKRQKKYPNINLTLHHMNAESTTYDNSVFDKIVIMYVYSVTPSPEKLLSEALRLCTDEGSIYIVNHFSNYTNKGLSFFEKMLSSMSNTIGFSSDFSYQKYIVDNNVIMESIKSANIFSLSKVIHLKKNKNLHLIKEP